MIVMRLAWVLGGQLHLLRQHWEQGGKIGNDVLLQRWERPHDALHDVLVLGRGLQLERPEQALQQRLGERGQVGRQHQGRGLRSTSYAHNENLERWKILVS